jgi:hypothetical protein
MMGPRGAGRDEPVRIRSTIRWPLRDDRRGRPTIGRFVLPRFPPAPRPPAVTRLPGGFCVKNPERHPTPGLLVQPFDPAKATALHWVRSADKPPGFELRDLDVPVASLRWVRHGGSLAEAETAGESWTVKRVGFLHPLVTARRTKGPPADAARLTVHWRRSLLELAGKAPSFLERVGVSVPAWQLVDGTGRRIVHVEPVAEAGRLAGGTVSVDPPGRENPDLLLSIVIAWYFVALHWTEEEIAAATGAALVAIS